MRLVLALALVSFAACAASPVVREVKVPLLVVPDCSVHSAFEQCKVSCIQQGLRPIEVWEDADRISCHCVPFDS